MCVVQRDLTCVCLYYLAVIVVQRDWTSEFAKQQLASQITTERGGGNSSGQSANSAEQCKSFGAVWRISPFCFNVWSCPPFPIAGFPPLLTGGGGGSVKLAEPERNWVSAELRRRWPEFEQPLHWPDWPECERPDTLCFVSPLAIVALLWLLLPAGGRDQLIAASLPNLLIRLSAARPAASEQ